MSTISKFTPMYETSGSVAKRTGLKDCTPNCPPNCPDCGQINFRQKGDVYDSYEARRKKKINTALLVAGSVILASAGAVFGLGKLHNSPKIANLKDGWLKTGLENVTRGCDKACNWTKNTAIKAWEWVKGKFSKKS